jgi:hypothetical protein
MSKYEAEVDDENKFKTFKVFGLLVYVAGK